LSAVWQRLLCVMGIDTHRHRAPTLRHTHTPGRGLVLQWSFHCGAYCPRSAVPLGSLPPKA
jgi:hypothetical protein